MAIVFSFAISLLLNFSCHLDQICCRIIQLHRARASLQQTAIYNTALWLQYEIVCITIMGGLNCNMLE